LIYGDTGKVVGKAILLPDNERVSRPEGPFSGLSGLKVYKDGMVKDPDGNVVGIVTSGDPKRLVGQAVDEDGDIIDKFGNVKGHAEPYEEEEEEEEEEPEEEEEVEPEETEEEKQRRQDDELADKMAAICQRTLEDVGPVLKQISEVCLRLSGANSRTYEADEFYGSAVSTSRGPTVPQKRTATRRNLSKTSSRSSNKRLAFFKNARVLFVVSTRMVALQLRPRDAQAHARPHRSNIALPNC
jgi:hypothetical protein